MYQPRRKNPSAAYFANTKDYSAYGSQPHAWAYSDDANGFESNRSQDFYQSRRFAEPEGYNLPEPRRLLNGHIERRGPTTSGSSGKPEGYDRKAMDHVTQLVVSGTNVAAAIKLECALSNLMQLLDVYIPFDKKCRK